MKYKNMKLHQEIGNPVPRISPMLKYKETQCNIFGFHS